MIPSFIDYAQDAIDKLLWQYRDSTNVKAFLEVTGTQLNFTQDDTFSIVENFNIENATGSVLDLVGKIVGESRGGRDDDNYRNAIIFRVVFNTSQGTPNRILEALLLATGATKVNIWEHYPVSAIFYTNGSEFPQGLASAIQNACPATCNGSLIIQDPNEDTFIPSELGIASDILVTQDDDEIVTQNNDEISVTSLVNTSPQISRGYLSEFTYGEGSGSEKDTRDGYGIFAEVLN